MPSGRLSIFGVWEEGKFIGAIIFGHGANAQIHQPFSVSRNEVCELVRVALRHHNTPVSKILGVVLRLIKKSMPNLKLIVSYADSEQGHHGGIYQATNWIFVGSITHSLYVLHGQRVHSRNVEGKYKGCTPLLPYLRRHVDKHANKIVTPPKYKYVFPLDREIEGRIKKTQAKAYPKRATSIGADAPTFQVGEGGSQPTVALQISREVGSCSGIAEVERNNA